MGKRISYFRNKSNIPLKDLIFNNYSAFRQWYLDTDQSSIEEFNEPFGNLEVKKYFKHNSNFKADFESLDKRLIDELTSEFISCYCDLTDRDGNLLELFGPTMSTWRYIESTQLVMETKDKDFIKLWQVIINGRSLKDNDDFCSFTNENSIGFLSHTECVTLKNYIETYFPHSFFHDSFRRPRSSGFEYVLSALEEINQYNTELVIDIEH